VQISAIDRERKARAERDDATDLPAAQYLLLQDALRALKERQFIDDISDGVVSHVEAVSRAVAAAGGWILIRRVDGAGGIVAPIAFAERLAVRIGESGGKSLGVAFLHLHLQALVTGICIAIEIADLI